VADSQITTWHYGLVARWWAEFNRDTPELYFLRWLIQKSGQPVLDAGCGNGRLLLPLLREQFDIDGCDVSADMLDLCRVQAESEALEVSLFAQPMHELDLPRRYRTIFMCGAFGLGGDRKQDRKCLQRCFDHLVPGGLLAFDVEVPYAHAERWTLWANGKWRGLPDPWPEQGDRRTTADGDELELRVRLLNIEPLEQTVTMAMRASRWRNGKLLAEEDHDLRETVYFKNEVMLMLELTGFEELGVYGGYQPAEPTGTEAMLTYIARKPEQP
jgi:SAM-dependent methyltransferase